MKLLYVLLIFVALASAEQKTLDIIDIDLLKTININNFVDRYIPHIAQFIVKNDLDPLKLPENVSKFWMVFPIVPPIMYKASLTLSSGILKQLSHLKRHGDTTLTYEDNLVKADIGIDFETLQGSYDYTLKLFILSPSGHVTASAENVRAKIILSFNTTDYALALDKFELQTAGRIKVALQHKINWADWIITPAVNAIIPLFKDTITKAVEVKTANAIRAFVEEINAKIPPHVLAYIIETELLKRDIEH